MTKQTNDIEKGEEMDQSQSSGTQVINRLLEPQERTVCEQLVSGEAPHSQRAQALLALNQGATQREAGQMAGLTPGQVKYWVGKFRQSRLSIFPTDVLEQVQPTADVPATADPAAASEESATLPDKKKTGKKSAVKQSKKKKAKKGKKGKKKTKKTKTRKKGKGKKSAAGKKSSKKKKKK